MLHTIHHMHRAARCVGVRESALPSLLPIVVKGSGECFPLNIFMPRGSRPRNHHAIARSFEL
jgi:hypothetical protein